MFAKMLCAFLCFSLLFIGVYLFAYVKCGREYEHALILVDNKRRINLWYPYELRETYSGSVELGVWGGDPPDGGRNLISSSSISEHEGQQVSLDGITSFQIGTNAIMGICRLPSSKEQATPTCHVEEIGFLFATNMCMVKYFKDEGECYKVARSYGMEGKKCLDFDENFKRHCARKGEPTLDELVSTIKNGLSQDELDDLYILFLIWVVVSWKVMRLSNEGRGKVC